MFVREPSERQVAPDVQIKPGAVINVTDRLVIGPGSVIGHGALIEGRSVRLGREAWIDEYAHIGGGSCFEKQSELEAGDFFHMGRFSHVNTARRVTIGHEVGIGIGTKIFTHGAYLSQFEGFPVQFATVRIGDRVWLPNAWVNPGVEIEHDVVVAAMSLVNENIPAGSLAGGIPAKVLRANKYPREITAQEKEELLATINATLGTTYRWEGDRLRVPDHGSPGTVFDLKSRTIEGSATTVTERLKNQLRRIGIRFRYSAEGGSYRPWSSPP